MGRWLKLILATFVFGTLGITVLCGLLSLPGSAGKGLPRPAPDLRELQSGAVVGEIVDKWRNIPVRANGIPYHQSHGRHFGPDGYYYGQQWQCVEFIKRFYYDRMKHAFPDGMGDAKEFFDSTVAHGSLNPKRGLVQFTNGFGMAPQLDDLMVWNEGRYGHVAIVSKVGDHFVEVVQQNVKDGSRMQLQVADKNRGYYISGWGVPAGFLRCRE